MNTLLPVAISYRINHFMKIRVGFAALGVLAVTVVTAHAQGISMNEYNKMNTQAQCAFIANLNAPGAIPIETIDKAYNQSVQTYIKDTGLARGFEYKPDAITLASDYAIFYQQATSDLYDEMFQSLKSQGLPLAPESWFKVAAQYWLSKSCASVIG